MKKKQVGITIEEEEFNFVKKNCYNFSSILRKAIQDLMQRKGVIKNAGTMDIRAEENIN